MAKKVVLSPTALANYESILKYLIGDWGVCVANDFIERFIKVRIVLSENTEIFSFENRSKRIQKCVLTKHNILFFRETNNVVEIIMIFDTRQDPKKLLRLLK